MSGSASAGLSAERVDARFGARAGHGIAAGLILGHVNATLTSGGGAEARTRMGRGDLVAMAGREG